MSLIETNLATQGIDKLNKYRILRRHLFAFIKHMTPRKLLNFLKAEFNMVTKKTQLSSYPYILKLESTNICNLQCRYCYDDRRQPLENERPYGKMTLEQYRKIIDELAPYLFKINLYGYGEPFLFPETIDMIQYATDNNIGMAISSNLNIKDNELAEKIISSGLEVLIFSCHGVSEKSYKEFTRKGKLDLALNNISRILKVRKQFGSTTPFIDWQYCVTRFNEGEIEEAKRIAEELGIDQIRFIKPYLPEDAEKSWYSSIFFGGGQEEEPVKPSRSCSWFYRSAYINQDGGVLPCCRDMRLLKNNYGNVFEEPFKKIWNNEKYITSRSLTKNDINSPALCKTMCHECPVFNEKVTR